jgi:hypothetical protein
LEISNVDNELCPPEIDPNPNRSRNLGTSKTWAREWTGVARFVSAGGWDGAAETAREVWHLAFWEGTLGPGLGGQGRDRFGISFRRKHPGNRKTGDLARYSGRGDGSEFQKFSFKESGRSEFRDERQKPTQLRRSLTFISVAQL